MSISTELQRIINAKQSIKIALLRKGYDISDNDLLDDYGVIIDPITRGQELSYLEKDANYLTFKWLENGKFYWKTTNRLFEKTIEYNRNNSGWQSITSGEDEYGFVCDCNTEDEIWVRGTNRSYAELNNDSITNYCSFYNTGLVYISGNVNSLINFENIDTINGSACFAHLFDNCYELDIDNYKKLLLPSVQLTSYCYADMFKCCISLTNAPELPATTLATGCYYEMFNGCANLIKTPNLPATTLAESCYREMFNGCASIKEIPRLSATTLQSNCYRAMFYNCGGLTSVQRLPATTLADHCYYSMFYGCVNLTNAPELPATTLVSYCYGYMFNGCSNLINAPELPATTLATYCYYYMFGNCTNLVNVPELSVTTLQNNCYRYMFYNCTNIITAPILPAKTLKTGCYDYMFNKCSKLNYIKALFTTTPSTSYTSNWVSGVAASGTFVKNSSATWNVSGVNGIPTGWTVETASS